MASAKQQPQDVTIERATLGTIFGFIGVTALLFAAIAFAWYLRFSATVVIALAVGLVGFLAWAAIAPKDFVATLTGRQARYGTAATFASLLLLGIIVLTYVIIDRANIAVDVTFGQEFTLSDTTREVLERIPQNSNIQITGFYTSEGLEQRDLDDQFFHQYELESDGQIVVEYINPQEQPAVAQRFGVNADGQVFISVLNDDGSVNFDQTVFVERRGVQERDITNALLRLLTNRVYKIYFAESMATLSIYDETESGLTLLDNNLRFNTLDTAVINLAQLATAGETIPEDAAVVVLPRRLLAMEDDEIAVIDEYLQRGGSLLILADLTFNERSFMAEGSAFNEYLRQNYGLGALDAIVIDPAYQVETPLDVIPAATFLEHPIGTIIPETATTFFRIARPVTVSDQKPPTVANGRIMSSSPQSYAETDIDAISNLNEYSFDPVADVQGPVDYVVWAEDVANEGGTGAKIVLIGDGNFAMNENIDSGAEGNAALFNASIQWLADIGETLNFGWSANPSAIPTIFVSGRQLDMIGLVTVVFVPLSVLLAGVIVWYRRTFA